MALAAEPVYINEIMRNSGARKRLITVKNLSADDYKGKVVDIPELPEWVTLESLDFGTELKIGGTARARTGGTNAKDFVVIVNADHQFFPEGSSESTQIKLLLQDEAGAEEELIIPLFLPKIIQEIPEFRGTFALDFGTSNSCYAYRKPFKHNVGHGSTTRGGSVATVSAEIPSVIFFRDVTSGSPLFTVGQDALVDMKTHPEKTYAYYLSIKRHLGVGDGTKFLVVDASPNTHSRELTETEISAYLVRGLLQMAQNEIGERITRVNATYPTLFSRPRKEALVRALHRSLWLLNGDAYVEYINPREAPDPAVALQRNDEVVDRYVRLILDEACAAAFGSVYQDIITQLMGGDVRGFERTLIAYDAGGGTTDIALMDIRVRRERSGAVVIAQDVRGLSGDSFYGGDNVTLEVFKLLKVKLAYLIAERTLAGAEPEEDEGEKSEDIWGAIASAAEEAEDDPLKKVWSDEETEEEVEEEKPEYYTPEEFDRAAQTVKDWAPALRMQLARRIGLAEALRSHAAEQKQALTGPELDQTARDLEWAMDLLVPTRWERFADLDKPHESRLARQIFYELWGEADQIKIRCVIDESKAGTVQGPLSGLAEYTGLDALIFNEVRIELHELETAIEPDIRRTVEKAFGLWQRADKEGDAGGATRQGADEAAAPSGGGIDFGASGPRNTADILSFGPTGAAAGAADLGAPTPTGPGGRPVKVLLAGNGSKLPIIRRVFVETFQRPQEELFAEAGAGDVSVKGVTALGACEVAERRRQTGTQGLLRLDSTDFTERLPYAIGLFNPDLRLAGWENGFMPLFERGAHPWLPADAKRTREIDAGSPRFWEGRAYLSAETNFLIWEGMEVLEIWADYRDGGAAIPLGLFDLLGRPSRDLTQEEHKECLEIIERSRSEQGLGDNGDVFGVLLQLNPNWELELINPKKNLVYALASRGESVDLERMPFSGRH
jgi:hypothetical protein